MAAARGLCGVRKHNIAPSQAHGECEQNKQCDDQKMHMIQMCRYALAECLSADLATAPRVTSLDRRCCHKPTEICPWQRSTIARRQAVPCLDMRFGNRTSPEPDPTHDFRIQWASHNGARQLCSFMLLKQGCVHEHVNGVRLYPRTVLLVQSFQILLPPVAGDHHTHGMHPHNIRHHVRGRCGQLYQI